MRVTRSVFVTSFMDMKILSASGMTDWWYCRYNIFVARNYSAAPPRFPRNPLYVARSRVNYTTARHEYRCKMRSPRCIVDPSESPVHPSISPIDDSISRGLRYSWPRGQICKQADVYSISPAQNDWNIQEKTLQYIIVTCTIKNILYLC